MRISLVIGTLLVVATPLLAQQVSQPANCLE